MDCVGICTFDFCESTISDAELDVLSYNAAEPRTEGWFLLVSYNHKLNSLTVDLRSNGRLRFDLSGSNLTRHSRVIRQALDSSSMKSTIGIVNKYVPIMIYFLQS